MKNPFSTGLEAILVKHGVNLETRSAESTMVVAERCDSLHRQLVGAVRDVAHESAKYADALAGGEMPWISPMTSSTITTAQTLTVEYRMRVDGFREMLAALFGNALRDDVMVEVQYQFKAAAPIKVSK